MGQKVNPIGFRLGIVKTWDSRWFAEKNYAELHLARTCSSAKFLKKKLYHAGVSQIEIERAANGASGCDIHTARPGIVIGKKGAEIEKLKKELEKLTDKEVLINIQEVRKPEVDAQLVAENIAIQLERRVAFRRAMKRAVQSALQLRGRGHQDRSAPAGWAARKSPAREWYREGRVPLHTLRADIDYGFAEARTTYGDHRRQGAGSSRARSCARTRRRRRTVKYRIADHAEPQEGQVPQDSRRAGCAASPAAGSTSPSATSACRPSAAAGSHARADRGRPYRHHPPRQARRAGLDPHLPGQADHQEAGRNPHGQGQGRARGLGRGGPRPAGSSTRWKASTREMAREAFRLAAHKLPSATQFVERGADDR